VDNASEFSAVMPKYTAWLEKKGLINRDGVKLKSFAFVTCGDWDLKKMMPNQCRQSRIELPTYFSSFVNIKQLYSEFYKRKEVGMKGMLNQLKMPLKGRHHSGLDDCRNISSILIRMIRDGAKIKETWQKY